MEINEKDAPISVAVVSGEHDVAPKFVSGTAPIYPTKVSDQNIRSGMAHLAFTITKTGRATNARVIEASHPQFAAGVAHVMPSWRFSPAKKGGMPVEVVVETKVNFHVVGI